MLPSTFIRILFEAREFDPFELTSFNPNEYHIFFGQTIMIGGAIVVDSMTTLKSLGILQSVPEGSPRDLSLASLQCVID
jgi:hypothetical protein